MTKLELEIHTPQKTLAKEDAVSQITIPAHWGQMGILPNHTHFITELTKGTVKFLVNDIEKKHEISSGLFVIKDNKATILAEE